jgi:hypothetical protein
MRRFTYDKWVGVWVPKTSVESANAAAAQLSGNPADALTFMRKATDAHGMVHYVATVPMREFAFDQLPQLQQQLGGGFGLLATRLQGRWLQHRSFEDWLAEVGLTLLEDEEPKDAEESAN